MCCIGGPQERHPRQHAGADRSDAHDRRSHRARCAEADYAQSITPACSLVSEDAPSRVILCAGAGSFARTIITETPGVFLSENERTPENVAANFAAISDETGEIVVQNALEQTGKLVKSPPTASGSSWQGDFALQGRW